MIYLSGVTVLLVLGWFLFQIGAWVGKVNADQEDFESFMDEVRADLREIRSAVWALLGRPTPAKGDGRLRLADYGEDISEAVDATWWASEQVENLKPRVAEMRPYEIEEIAFSHARGTELMPSMRDAMWEHSYSAEDVRVVLGIELRDELLKSQA